MYTCCKCNSQFKDLQHLRQHIVKKCVAKTQSPIVKPKSIVKEEKVLSSTEEIKNKVSNPKYAKLKSSVIEENNAAKKNITNKLESVERCNKSNNGQHAKKKRNELANPENMMDKGNDKPPGDTPDCDNNLVPRVIFFNPKVCSFCKKSFSFTFQLKNHKSTDCKGFLACKKKFKRTFSRKNICSSCNLKFTNSSALKTHKFSYCKLYKQNKRKRMIKAMKHDVSVDKKKSHLVGREDVEITIGNVNSEVSTTPSSTECSKILEDNAVFANKEIDLTLKISNIENKNKRKQPNDSLKVSEDAATSLLNKKPNQIGLGSLVCDICYYDFENIVALTKHKAFYCRRFNAAEHKKSDLSLHATNKSKSLGVASCDIKKSAVSKGVQSKGNDEKTSSLLGDNANEKNAKTPCDAKNNADSLIASNVAQKNVCKVDNIVNTSKANCIQCGTFFDHEHDRTNHICKLDSNDSKQSESTKSLPNIKHPKCDSPTKKRKRKKLKFLCPYCHEGQVTKSDLSTHKMLYCKEANKKKLALIKTNEQKDKNSKNEAENSVQMSRLPNPQTSEQASLAENDENRKLYNIQSVTAKGKTPKRLITAPEKDPDEDRNICNICGTQFEFSFALQRHKALYCKVFNISKPTDINQKSEKSKSNDTDISENCNANLNNEKDVEAHKTSVVMSVETKMPIKSLDDQEAKRRRKEEKKQKKASETQSNLAEEGPAVKCDKCELVFKYEVDLLWHKYKYCGKKVVTPEAFGQNDLPKLKKEKLRAKREKRVRQYIDNILVENDTHESNIQKVKSAEKECVPDKHAEKGLNLSDVNSEDKDKQKIAFDLRNKISNTSSSQCKQMPNKPITKETYTALNKSNNKYYSQSKELFQPKKGFERDMSPKSRESSLRSNPRKLSSGSRSEAVTLKVSRNVCEIRGTSKKTIKETSHSTHISSTRTYREVTNSTSEMRKPSIFCETCGEHMNSVKDVYKPRCGHKNSLFKCPVCKSYFSNINLLILHQEKKHDASEVLAKEKGKADKKYFCFLCGIYFRYIDNFIDHNVSYHKYFYRKSQKHCEKPFIRPANPELKGYACVFCNDKLFDSLELLIRHEEHSKSHEKNVDIFKTLKPNYSSVEHRRFKHICYICKLGFVSFRDQQIHTLECVNHYALENKAFEIAAKAALDREDSRIKRADLQKNRYKPIPFISTRGSRSKTNKGLSPKNIKPVDLYKRIKNMLNGDLNPSVSTPNQSVSLTSTNPSSVRDSHSPSSTSNQELTFINCSSPENFSSPNSECELPTTPTSEQKVPKISSVSGDPFDLETSFVRYYDTEKKAALKYEDNEQKADVSEDINKISDIDDDVKVVETYECFVCGEAFESSPLLEKHLCAGPF